MEARSLQHTLQSKQARRSDIQNRHKSSLAEWQDRAAWGSLQDGAAWGSLQDSTRKGKSRVVISNEEEMRMLMQEVEQAKNRYANRSGFSPVQRQLGQWPRGPGELLSDDVVDPLLASGALVDDIERFHEVRRDRRCSPSFEVGPLLLRNTDLETWSMSIVRRLRKKKTGGVEVSDTARVTVWGELWKVA